MTGLICAISREPNNQFFSEEYPEKFAWRTWRNTEEAGDGGSGCHTTGGVEEAGALVVATLVGQVRHKRRITGTCGDGLGMMASGMAKT